MIAWRKNPIILADNFVKDYKSCESYLKYCVNILKKLNWLKKHHFDKDIPTKDWIKEYFKISGYDLMGFSSFFNYYNKNILPTIPQEELKILKTNQYCVDSVKEFFESFGILTFDNAITDGSPQILQTQKKHQFTQVCHIVKTNNYDVNEEREYSDKEIVDMIFDQKILVIDSFVKPSNIDEKILIEKYLRGEIEYLDRDFYGGILCSCAGDVAGYVESNSEYERDSWIAKNILKLQWLRDNGLSFGNDDNVVIDEVKFFTRVVDHIDVVCSAIEKNYKKRKKVIPDKYSVLLKGVKQKAKEENEIFNHSEICSKFIDGDFISN